MTSLVVFILVAYSLTFLVADASIFGCGTAAYKENPDDVEYIWSKGIFKIRPHFLQVHFFRELFSCYFCLGIWTGSIAHTLLYYAVGERYWFYHVNTQQQWFLGFMLTSLVSAAGCYFVDTLIDRLSVSPEPPQLISYTSDGEEFHRGHSTDDN